MYSLPLRSGHLVLPLSIRTHVRPNMTLYNVIYASWGIIGVPWTHSPFIIIKLYSVKGPSKIIHLKHLHRKKAIGFVGKVVRSQRQVNSCDGACRMHRRRRIWCRHQQAPRNLGGAVAATTTTVCMGSLKTCTNSIKRNPMLIKTYS